MMYFQEPLLFIASLASCSVLTLEQLGWDPSIEVWNGDCVVPSYRAEMQQFALTYHMPWVISAFSGMHSASSESQRANIDQQEHYVMIQCLILQDAKWLWRRATIVMEVVLLEDWKNKNEKVRSLWWDEWHADPLSLRLISMLWNNCGNDFLDLMVMHWPSWTLRLNWMKVSVETSYSSKSSSPYCLRSLFFIVQTLIPTWRSLFFVVQTSIPTWKWLNLFK